MCFTYFNLCKQLLDICMGDSFFLHCLLKKEHGGAKSDVWCTINRFKLPSSAYTADRSKAAPLYVLQTYAFFIA
jgi:hypothetical protein